jgi:hypothetical protein
MTPVAASGWRSRSSHLVGVVVVMPVAILAVGAGGVTRYSRMYARRPAAKGRPRAAPSRT